MWSPLQAARFQVTGGQGRTRSFCGSAQSRRTTAIRAARRTWFADSLSATGLCGDRSLGCASEIGPNLVVSRQIASLAIADRRSLREADPVNQQEMITAFMVTY